jgi:hypothetical protein
VMEALNHYESMWGGLLVYASDKYFDGELIKICKNEWYGGVRILDCCGSCEGGLKLWWNKMLLGFICYVCTCIWFDVGFKMATSM